MQSGHLNRILREAGGAKVLEALADELSPTDLQSLLLEVSRRRAAKVSPARLMERYEHDRFVKPAAADVRDMVEFDRLAFSVAERFEAIELSPVCPLGSVSALGLVDQNNVIATTRGTEVVADSTNVMALECARRRKKQDLVRLCASHRLIRAQPVSGPASFAHFRVFTMCTVGRDTGAMAFETAALIEHLTVYLRLLSSLSITNVRVCLTDFTGEHGTVVEHVLSELNAKFPGTQMEPYPERTQARNYYDRLAMWLFVKDKVGNEYNIGDGGFTDWTRKLLSNQKERMMISALGSERLCYLFPRDRSKASSSPY